MKFAQLLFLFTLLATNPLFAMDWWGDDVKAQRRKAQAEREQKEFAEIKRKQEATEELKVYARNLLAPTQHHSILETNFVKILAKGADPNITIQDKEGWHQSLLTLAILGGYTAIVKALLDAGANPNTTDQLRNSVLHIAAQKGFFFIAQFLIEKGANPNSINARGFSPLFAAITSQAHVPTRVNLIKYLLDSNADVNYKTSNGATPLSSAIVHLSGALNVPSEITIIKTLLNAGADPNIDSPLDLAINFIPSATLIALLLQAGADPNLPFKGKTPLQFAQEKLAQASSEQAINTFETIIKMLKDPTKIKRTGLEQLSLKPEIQKKLEEHQINQEIETIQASEEYKKAAQEAAEKHLEQLKKDKK